MMDWISVEDQEPSKEKDILVLDGNGIATQVQFYKDCEGWSANYWGTHYEELDITFTHWMELPKPPKEE